MISEVCEASCVHCQRARAFADEWAASNSNAAGSFRPKFGDASGANSSNRDAELLNGFCKKLTSLVSAAFEHLRGRRSRVLGGDGGGVCVEVQVADVRFSHDPRLCEFCARSRKVLGTRGGDAA